MALRVTFREVIDNVRAEAKLSTNTSRGLDHQEHIKQLIRRHYYTLADDFDWPHLSIKKESAESRKLLAAGSRFYDFPANLNPEKIERLWVKWGSAWLPVTKGISYDNYTAYNPDDDQRVDPITHWDFYGHSQIEVWPVPATDGVQNGINEIAFEGQRLAERLVDDNSRLDLDDILVTLMVATEILLSHGKKDDAAVKGEAAADRLQRMRAGRSSQTRYRMGLGKVPESGGHMYPRHPKFVR